VNLGGTRSSEIVVDIESKYHHFITIWDGVFDEMENTNKDNYHYLNLTENQQIYVELSDLNGVMCMSMKEHPIILLDQNKTSLDPTPTPISTQSELLTMKVVEKYLMEDIDSRRLLDDINRFSTNIDFADDIDMTEKRLETMGTAYIETENVDYDDGLSVDVEDDDSIYDIMNELNANFFNNTETSSHQSSITGAHVSYAVNDSDTDDSELSNYIHDNYDVNDMIEDSMVTTVDNTMYPTSELVNIIRNEKATRPIGSLINMINRKVRGSGYYLRRNIYAIKMFPDMPNELKMGFHHDDEVVLKILDDADLFYQGNFRFKFFKAYILNVLINTYGMERVRELSNMVCPSSNILVFIKI
jgi:hypothetical protein